jgi:transcriptional regulator with XRE-family HTH domain
MESIHPIKKQRERFGYTQSELAKQTGLSLRTIQRLEKNEKPPKGHSLKVLSQVFDMTPSDFQQAFNTEKTPRFQPEDVSIRLINLSVLGFFIFPFGNIFLTWYMWRRNRTTALVDEIGRRIINFQILWSLLLCILLSISPFIEHYLSLPIRPIWLSLFGLIAINLIVVFRTAYFIHHKQFDFLNLKIRLI